MDDFLFRGSLRELDSEVFELTQLEAERQARKLILIASESQAPLAVLEALGTAFQNIYAEGYPDEPTRGMSQEEILDYASRLAEFRRYSDPRYYKGVEYADFIEALARRRGAELFATDDFPANSIFVNVQALSGAPANNAVYHALINPGDTILGMDLLHGGHLTHGSPVNRSGKLYKAVHYTVDPETEHINYDQVEELARSHKPKVIVAGYSSYPWMVDWARFKAIAKSVSAFLLADIAHVAGLVAGGVYPTPVGYADVITFTTHKTMNGPRGACILTTDPTLARKIDRAVFPGEQGGPHVNVFAAIALAFKLARTEQFRQLQQQTVDNCLLLSEHLKARGIRIAYGGTNTHLTNVDCSCIKGPDGTTLSGDQAARILDIAGIVVNRNTIPGDKSAADPSGIRMGTSWITQRGFQQPQMLQLADAIADLLQANTPFGLEGRKGEMRRTKVEFGVLEEVKLRVRDLAHLAGIDFEPARHGYPHFYYLDDKPLKSDTAYEIRGERVRSFVNFAFSSSADHLLAGQVQITKLYTPKGEVDGLLSLINPHCFRFFVSGGNSGLAAAWLRNLSDGYVAFDDDPLRKLPGPVIVQEVEATAPKAADENEVSRDKPYYIGQLGSHGSQPLPPFEWQDQEGALKRTPVYDLHKKLGAKIIPFAGWEMPVWYTSVIEEHLAVREAAGLFDVAHMGVYQVEGPDAAVFLDCVVGNDISGLGIGESCYTHFLTPEANVIDDLLIYHRAQEKFLVVVNASNDDKDWNWLNQVKEGKVRVSNANPGAVAYGLNARLRNLRNPQEGEDMRVDIALQGPRSWDILLSLGADADTRKRILALKRTQLCDAVVGGFDLVLSRTGYTGEKLAFELFVHPNRAAELFERLLEVGQPMGIKPVGLGARDSLRTEAGLPLYGHEMGAGSGHMGERDLGVAEGGFGTYVKTYKPWFIGREAYLEREKSRKGVVARYRFNEKGMRMAHSGDPVIDKRGRVIGWVTSCAVDKEGYLTGQAYIELKSADEGTPIFIFQSAPDKAGKAPAELMVTDKALLPAAAMVISRFPR